MKFIPERPRWRPRHVVWTNKDFLPPASRRAKSASSPDLGPDKSWRFTHERKRDCLICRLHPVMKGLLVVK